MKTKIFTRLLGVAALSIICSSATWAQVPSGYLCSIRNDSLVSSTVYEFDIYLLNTDLVNVFEYDLFQAGIVLNSSIVNGGTITASMVPGSSQLVATQQPASITFTAAQNCIKLGPGGIVPHGSATIISTTSPGTRIIRIRLTNTVAFGQFSPNFSFNFTPSPYNTVVTAYNQTAPFLGVNITNSANHTVATMTNPILNAPVTAFNMTGGGNYCVGSTGAAVGLSGSETGVNYKLIKNTVPVGSNIPGTGSALSFGNQLAGTYTASAYRKATYLTNSMTGSVTTAQLIVNPTLAGPASTCIGATGNVYTTETGMTNYAWTISSGGTITAGGTLTDNTVTITWNTLGAQSVSINYASSGCTAANPTSFAVTVNSSPVPTISGSNSVCAGTTGVVYTTEAGMTSYAWTISGGGTITAGGTSTSNTATVTWNTAGAQSVNVNYTNASGCTSAAPTSYSVTVNAKPTPTIAGNNNVCAGTAGVIYTTEAGQSSYIWSVSAGGLITAGGTSANNTVTVTWNTAGAQSVSVNYTNAAGCNANTPVSYPVTVISVPTPSISGLNSVCQGTTGVVYTTEAGKTSYSWTISSGGIITAGGTSTSTTATATWNTAGAQSISVNYSNGVCSASSPTSYPVVVNSRPVPTISGSNNVCTGTAGVVYTTEAGMASYIWNISAGGTITAGGTSTDNAITVTWNTPGTQSVTVNYTSGSCNAINPTSYAVTVGSSFSATISGNKSPCIGATGVVYTTEPGMTNYIWVVSAGGSVTSGGTSTSNSVTVTWNTAGAQTVSVNYTNGICTPIAPTVYPVSVKNIVGTPTAITVSAGTEPTCQLINGTTATTYATTSIDNTGFNWSLSNALAGSISPATGIMIWANGFSGSVNIQVTANGCGGPSAQVTRTVNIAPTVGTPTAITISSGSDPTCQLTNGTTTTTYASTAVNSTGFNWTISNALAGSIGATTGVMTWANEFSGSVDIRVTANGCNGPSAMVVHTVNVTPAVGTPTAITVSAGTEPTCQLTNGTTTTTYATTASNSTGFNWSISNPLAGSIGATTGIMTWANGFAGSVDIQVTANGCNGTSAQVIHNVSILPTVGTPTSITISAGSEPTCQLTNGTTTTTYATTAINSTGFSWSLSNPSAGTINATTGVMTWANLFSGTVNIQVVANGCNGPSAQVIRTVNITPNVGTPAAITISAGTEPTCQLTNGTTTTTYVTTAANSTGFNWSVSNALAGTINATTGVMTWANGFSGNVNIQVSANGCNGPSVQVIRTVNVTPTVGTPTSITISAGIQPTCQLTNGSTTTTYATTASNSTGFNWSVSNALAGTINATTGIMTWANGFSGTVNIQVSANGCNGPSAQTAHAVSITPTVGTPTAITVSAGSEPTCQLINGTTTTTYATTAPNSAGFNWLVSNALAGTINATTGVMTWANGFSGSVDIQVTANGCNGPSAQIIRTVNVGPTVGIPTSITVSAGTEPTCQLTNGTTTTTYATTATNSTGFNWSVSNALAGTINASTGVMTWANGFSGSVNIQVTANGCNGPSSQIIRTVSVTPTVGTPTAITVSAGSEPTCQLTNGTTTTTYSTTATNSTGFNWSLSNALAGTINPTTGVMTWANGFSGSVNIQVTANGCNGTSAQAIHTVNVSPGAGVPTAITVSAGTEPTCQLTNGTTTTTYTTTSTNSTGFNWSISNVLAGTIDHTTGVMTWANGFSGSVNIQVTANGCNGTSAQVIRTVNVAPTVGTPTSITVSAGTEPTCQPTNGTTTTTYATTATNSIGFNWSVSNALAGIINPTSGVMTWANGFSGSVNIQVTANGCNGPSTQVIRTVNVTPTVGTPTAITVSAGSEPTCQLTNGTTTTTFTTTATNSTGFNWSVSNALAGTINPTTGVMTWANGFSGSVNIQVTANGCNGPSAQVIHTVNVSPGAGLPTAITVSAGTEPTCQLTNGTTTTTYTTTSTNSSGFNWSINNVLAGTIDHTTGIMTWANGFSGSINIQVTANGCNGTSAQVIRTVNVAPTVGTPTSITVSAGTEPTCQLTNGTTTTTYATTATNSTGFNWSVSNALAGTINASAGVMTWANGFSGSVNIQVTANGCNGPSAQIIRTVNVTPTVGTPTAITVSAGSEPTCQLTNGTTTTTYATTAINNIGFNWSVSNTLAGSVNPTTGVMTWANGFSGSVNIQVTANGCNGPSSQVIRTVNVTPTVGTPTAITVSAGSEPTCQLTNGTTTTTYSTTATNSTGFNWSVSNALAGTIDHTTGIMTWANGFSGSVNIQVTANGCSGPSAQFIRTVNVTPTVGTPTAITVSAGIEPTCQLTNGTTMTTYTTTSTNSTGYNWSISNALAGTINPITGVMAWANGFSGSINIQVTANGCNSPSAQVIRTVNVTPTVGTPTAITVSAGPEPTCQLTNGNTITMYATTATNSTGFNWSISNALAGSINPITGVMTWTNGFSGSVNIQVTANGCNGPSSQVIRTINLTPTVGTPTAITISGGTEPMCQLTNGTTTTNYATTATNNTGFFWSISNPLAGSINTSTGVMTWANGFSGIVDIQVRANGCNGPSVPVFRTVTVNPRPVPTISGQNAVCTGSTGIVYITQSGMTNYVWVVSAGGTITAGGTSTDNTVTISWNTPGAQSVSVNYTNGLCAAPSPVVYNVNVGTIFNPTISGNNAPCIGATGVVYTTEAGMTNYVWGISAGGVITAGGTSTNYSVTVTWNAGGPQWVEVDYTNGACTSPIPSIYTVNVMNAVGTPTAITISAGSEPSCQISNGTTTTTYATTAANSTGFNWSISNALAGTINPTTGVMTWANGFAGSVNIQVTASGCNGVSPQVIRPVIVTPTVGTPAAITISAGTEPACQLTNGTTTTTYSTSAINSTGFNWSISNALAGSINANTGLMTWASGFSGSVNIQVAANGCNGPSLQVIRTVNVIPTVGTPSAISVSNGSEPICQLSNGTTTTTYSTTATNSTGFNWSISNPLAGSINPTTGVMAWANGFSGSVNIQVTANGCNGPSGQTIRPVTVNSNLPVSLSIGSSANPVASGTLVTFTATPVNGGANPAYQWQVNGLNTGTNASTYAYIPVNGDAVACILTSNATCASGNPALSNTIVMSVTSVPVSITVSGSVGNLQNICYDATQTINVAGGAATFVVLNGGSVTMIAGQNILYFPGTTVQYGGYMHGYISNVYCGQKAPSVVNTFTGEEEQMILTQKTIFKLYPNPTSGKFTLEQMGEIISGKVKVEVYVMSGERVMSEEIEGERMHEFWLTDQPYGLYFVRVVGGGYVETFKLIKTR